MRPRSIVKYSGRVICGWTCAPVESRHSKWTISPGAMVSLGGRARFQRDCVGSAERLSSVMEFLDFDCHLEFDQRVARQRGNPDGGSHVPGRFTQKLDKKIGGAVDDCWAIGKARNRVHVAGNADNSLDVVERT